MAIPAFTKIGGNFAIGQTEYNGLCLASPDALFLFLRAKHNRDLLWGAIGGAVAGAAGHALGNLIRNTVVSGTDENKQPLTICTVQELPTAVREHPEWPLKRKRNAHRRSVLVVPRGAVEMIEHPRFSNLLRTRVNGVAITIEYFYFRGTRIRRYLNRSGWPLTWAGRLVDAENG